MEPFKDYHVKRIKNVNYFLLLIVTFKFVYLINPSSSVTSFHVAFSGKELFILFNGEVKDMAKTRYPSRQVACAHALPHFAQHE